MTKTRRLAAIMAVDVVGYSRLIGEDEAGTAAAVREHREAARPIVGRFGGRIVKTMGLADFRFHDLRHTAATRLRRETGNIRLVQEALNHADIATTTRYAHVAKTEIADAMQRVAESRKKSRTDVASSAQVLNKKEDIRLPTAFGSCRADAEMRLTELEKSFQFGAVAAPARE